MGEDGLTLKTDLRDALPAATRPRTGAEMGALQRLALPCAERSTPGFPLSWEQFPDVIGKLLGQGATTLRLEDAAALWLK